jgi:hypothetical protein
MMQADTFTLDPLRAGCCAVITRPTGIEHPARTEGCADLVIYAGWVGLAGRRRVLAFACRRHRDLLADPAAFGVDPRHRAELARRRDRDRWLRGGHR